MRISDYFNCEFSFKEPKFAPLIDCDNIGDAVIETEKLTPQQENEELFRTMVFRDNITDAKGKILLNNIKERAEIRANKIISNKARYEKISHYFSNPIRWYHIGLIHEMEGELNFNTYLGNGQRLDRKTTIVPKGRGPFRTFESGAIDAIRLDELDKVQDWSIGNTLYVLEKFNGYGYRRYKGIWSPYIWSGSDKYTAGKYVSDGIYSPTAVSVQIGIALIYKIIIDKGYLL